MKPSRKIPVLVILALLLSSLACQAAWSFGSNNSNTEQAPAVELPALPTLPEPLVQPQGNLDLVSVQEALTALYERINPGVVSIRVLTESGGGQGSGFVIDTQGHIVTNYHVVENATQVEVDFPSGVKVYGQVLGTDLDSDLAVIKVDVPAESLQPLPLGNSDQVKVGQTVVAIGNPFGLSGTMTVGIISGKSRTLDSLRESPDGSFFTSGDVIQTDAAINPGNSGGPLLNLNGEVIGVNRAIRTGNFTLEGEPTNSGVGFAVSVNIVKRVAPSLIAGKQYDYPYLGVSGLNEITLSVADDLNLPQTSGVYVTEIVQGGPADDAGVQDGDLITKVDGVAVANFSDMIGYLFVNKSPGDQVVLTILRNDRETEVTVTLGSRP
jgi:2-alkenal reductase